MIGTIFTWIGVLIVAAVFFAGVRWILRQFRKRGISKDDG